MEKLDNFLKEKIEWYVWNNKIKDINFEIKAEFHFSKLLYLKMVIKI